MANEVSTASSSNPRLTWSQALILLESPSPHGVPPSVSTFLRSHLDQLQRPHDPFPPSQHSKAQLSSGTLTLAHRQVAVSKPDQLLALDVATRFECDELEALDALRHARRAKGAHPDKLVEDEWDRVTAWLFEERMAVLAVVALLLRSYDDPANACYDLAVELVPEIVSPSFTSSLLAAFTRRTTQHLPDAVRPSRTHSAFWTKQLVREQKTLLELVFLAYYSPRQPDGLELARVLEAIKATEFGQRQELFGHFDAEAQGVVREIGDLLAVVALEACNLEQAMELEYPIGAPGEATVDASSVFHPSNLVKVTGLVEGLVGLDAERASPILLAWAFLLSKVTASLLERGVPEAYHDWAEQSLRVEAPSSSSSRSSSTQPLFQLYASHALSPSSAFFPVLLSILRSPLLGHSAQRESFSAAANHEPNAIGYLSVLRGLVVSIPNLVRLTFLSPAQLSALYDAFAALYGNAASATMCSNFWNEQAALSAALDGDDESSMLLERTAQSTGESDVVDLARSRFPLQFGGLTGLVRALCAGAAGLVPAEQPGGGSPAASNDDELLAARCAQSAFAYLATLPSLTHVVPSASVPGIGAAAPLPYEVAAYPDPETGYAYRATRPIGVSRSVAIPVGAQGRLVSQQGTKPVVVAWDVEWSAWRLFADVLEDYAGGQGRAGGAAGPGAGARRDVFGSKEAQTDGLPMEWDSEDEHDKDVTAVLDILRITLHNDHSLAVALIDHLATAPGRLAESADPASARNSFVEVLFRILERSLAPNLDRPPPTALVSSLLGLIAALLPSFPGVIWTYLRGSALLFPSTKASSNSASGFGYGAGAAGIASSSSSARPQVLHAERLSGQYPVTLALLSLVHALALEEQVAACVTRSDFRETKHGVLVRALAWVRDTVWPSFGAWRFASLVEKYELARRCTAVFKLVLEESAVAAAASTSSSSSSSSSSPVVQVVTEAFIGPRATVAQLSPVLSTLASGPDGILLLRKAGRFADAQALEDLVRSSLSLVLGLLRLRRRTKGTSSSLLEKLCLSPTGSASYAVTAGSAHGFAAELDSSGGVEGPPARRPELLESLVRFVVAPLDGALAVQAARIVTLLCLSGAAGEAAPASMTAILGGSEGLERLLTALLAVVEDHLAAQEVQVAIWDLLSAIVDSQPGLGMLLVTGRSSPFSIDDLVPAPPKDDKGKARELNDAEKAAQELAKSLAPSAPKPLSRTAIGVALSTLGTWSTIWSERPALLAAVLRFFDFAWQHLVEYGAALDDFRARTSTWEAFVKIACENPGSEPHDEEGVADYCDRVTARAHAARILALDVQAALAKPKAEEAPSVKAFLAAFQNPVKVGAAVTSAMASSCAPELHQGIYELVHSTFPGLDLDALRNAPSTHPLDEAREFGSEYLYALALVRRRLDGFVVDADSAIDGDALADVVAQTAQLNRNFSLLEAQILDTRSWRQLLEIVSPLARKDAATSATSAVGLVAREIAHETRGGQIMTTVQAERLSILLTLVQVLGGVEPTKAKTALFDLVVSMAAMFASETLQPLESVARRETPVVHVSLFRTAYLAFRQLEACAPTPKAAPDLASKAADEAVDSEQRTSLATATEAILRDVLTATRDLLVLARARNDLDIEQDLALAVAVVSQVLKSAYAPPAAVWLAHLHALDLLRCAFDVFVHMDHLEPGKPLYAQHVLDLCLAFATSSPRAAEQLPLEGAMTALTNNALTAAAEAGAIALVSPTDAARTPQHELWTSMLALVVALVAALGESTRFVEQDVTGFVRLYGQQVVRALSWTSSTPVTAAGLEELSAVVALMHGIARSSSATGVSASSPVVAVAGVFVEQSLHLLQHLVYALLHPNHLAALVEGLTPAERGYLEKEAAEPDVDKRPVAQAVTLKVVQLTRDLVGALVEFAEAWAILLRDPMDWRSERAVVLPTATVTAGDKASLGTLFDLSTFCIDTLRSPPASSPAPSLPSPSPFPTLPPASQPVLRAACAETLEACLLLSATQLALHAQQQGGASRALHELGGEVGELVDKAVGLNVPGAEKDDERNRKALLEVVRRKLGTWV